MGSINWTWLIIGILVALFGLPLVSRLLNRGA